MSTSNTALFPQLQRQMRTQILMYSYVHSGFACASTAHLQKNHDC